MLKKQILDDDHVNSDSFSSNWCCWLYFGCKFTYPNFLFKSKNWIPLSQYNLCLSEITGQLHHIKVDRWVCSVGAMPGPDIRPYQLRNRKNWGVMHCNLEQSVCCVLILVAGTFELWHCHYQTNFNSVFSRCDVRHALIWGATNPLIFGNVESLTKTKIFRDASFPPPTKSTSSSQNIQNKKLKWDKLRNSAVHRSKAE